jgi:hypothetical protein
VTLDCATRIWRSYVLGILLLVLVPHEAAAGNVDEAARAFDEGQKAQLKGDYDRAANWFEIANSIVPTKEALRSAIRAHLKAGRLARAATLSEAARATYAADTDTVLLANEVLEEVVRTLGRLELTCSGGCTVSVDGRVLSISKGPDHVLYMPAGVQRIRVHLRDRSVARTITTKAGTTVIVEVPALPPKPVAPAVELRPKQAEGTRRGLPRGVPVIGGSLTLIGAGVATWSSFDTRAARSAYGMNPEHSAWIEGRKKQRRTNILWGATAGLGIVTLITAYWTNWHPAKEAENFGIASSDGDDLVITFGTRF